MQYMFVMPRKKALRDSPAGEPRQGVKVCDLLNSENRTASLHASHKAEQRTYANWVCVLNVTRRRRSLFFLRFEGFPHLLA
uniref:Uncharacterized protein n=1 Tax=uncultured prokaryote TaxID=198431 RepID=A0A0H5QL23_9ZZZZ|nr:hypothetical protein [uncultured prokaryote]